MYLPNVVFWILAIRGHIPQHDGFPAAGGGAPLATSGALRVLAAAMAVFAVAVLALTLWAVWLAIKWL